MQALSLSSVMASFFCTRRDTTALIPHRLRCSGRTPTAVSMCSRLKGTAQCLISRWDPSLPVAMCLPVLAIVMSCQPGLCHSVHLPQHCLPA